MTHKNYASITCAYIESISSATNTYEIVNCLLDVAAEYGLTAVFGGIVPTENASRSEIDAHILLQRFPIEWARRYNERAYVFRDPIVHRLKVDRDPFSWHESYASCPCADDVKLIQGEASDFCLRDGYVVPVTTLDGGLSAVSFGGDHIEIGDEGRAALGFATNYAVGHLLHQRSRTKANEDPTPREFDCLLWAAEGKTDWEISVILGISKSTVVKHLLAARDKLGAVNKAHAIATALRLKLIR